LRKTRAHRNDRSAAQPQPNFWSAAGIPQSGSHAAFTELVGVPKRCRRCAPVFAALRLGRLPPHSKILAALADSDVLQCNVRVSLTRLQRPWRACSPTSEFGIKHHVTLAVKVQNATETLREISAGAREKSALIFLFTAANKLSFAQCKHEICRVLFGNIVPVTFIQIFLVTTICRV
jgi:hypothetical protein